ncbi:hypothetical protein [Moorena sp. SIO3I6]|uniref:hypothetical protein n=1 Tax=Moorena sp. SIO3I6 TaxID=2607831 RepID=UPI0013F816DF|nr:hypothetical protein [Moorena sp. SIO3I6]NEP25504.1 hypothetical protein [Moorena sp. SIO3I6]
MLTNYLIDKYSLNRYKYKIFNINYTHIFLPIYCSLSPIPYSLFPDPLFPVPDSRFPFPSWEGLGVGSDSRFPIP